MTQFLSQKFYSYLLSGLVVVVYLAKLINSLLNIIYIID